MTIALDGAWDWIFEDSRPDLLEGWFRQLQGIVYNTKNRVRKLTYGGIGETTTPAEVLSDIRHHLRQALFLHAMATKVLAKRLPELEESVAANLERYAVRFIEDMARDIEVISECEEMIASIAQDITKAGL